MNDPIANTLQALLDASQQSAEVVLPTGAQAGSTVSARLANGRRIQAFCPNAANPGPAIALLGNSGWVILSSPSSQVVGERGINFRQRRTDEERVREVIYFLWFRGGSGPPEPEPIPENATGTFIRLSGNARRLNYDLNSCGGLQSNAQTFRVNGPAIPPFTRTAINPTTEFCGFDTFRQVEVVDDNGRVFISPIMDFRNPPDTNFTINWAFNPTPSVSSYEYNFPPPTPEEEDEWLDEQPWERREYPLEITAEKQEGALVVLSAADGSEVDRISITVVQFQITRDPDFNPNPPSP